MRRPKPRSVLIAEEFGDYVSHHKGAGGSAEARTTQCRPTDRRRLAPEDSRAEVHLVRPGVAAMTGDSEGVGSGLSGYRHQPG